MSGVAWHPPCLASIFILLDPSLLFSSSRPMAPCNVCRRSPSSSRGSPKDLKKKFRCVHLSAPPPPPPEPTSVSFGWRTTLGCGWGGRCVGLLGRVQSLVGLTPLPNHPSPSPPPNTTARPFAASTNIFLFQPREALPFCIPFCARPRVSAPRQVARFCLVPPVPLPLPLVAKACVPVLPSLGLLLCPLGGASRRRQSRPVLC